MLDFILRLFSTDDFPARWHCGNWTELHGWIHIISDLAIFAAYVTIPCVLAYFVTKRDDVPFGKVFVLFGAFICFCGVTHAVEALIFWQPVYRVSAVLKLGTAVVSWATVAALVPLVPNVLTFRSPAALAEEVLARTKELRHSEKALQNLNDVLHAKNEEMEQFVYSVSHDLKSPLVTSSGFLAELRDDLERGDMAAAQDSMLRIDRANQRMSQLINDLLDLSRLGRVQIEPGWLDAGKLMAEVVGSLEKQIQSVAAQVRVAPSVPPLYADKHHLVQVLENLLTNALKYACDDPNRLIEIGAEKEATQVCLYVRDQGPGVPQSDRERIFGLFERGNAKRPGTGIGLAVVARIAKTHGGKAWVESGVDGATFWVSFPTPRASVA